MSILVKQFSLISSVNFSVPNVSGASVGVNLDSNSRLILGYKTDCKGETSLSPIREAQGGDVSILGSNIYSTGFNNLGVPSAGVLDINQVGYGNPSNGIGNYNPYFARMSSNQSSASILLDAVSQNPTFFTIELGEADLMTFAKSGGTSTSPPVANGTMGIGFDGSLEEIVSALDINGAKGAISNVPDVLSYPYFTTIPYNGLKLDVDKAATLNNVFNSLGLFFVVGDNPFVIVDTTQAINVRKMVEGELVLLSAPLDSVKCFGMGSIFGIPDKHILTIQEISTINSYQVGYNSAISTVAQAHNLAEVDKKNLITSLSTGIVYNGVSMSTEFVTGGAFSLDGRNLNPSGQALLANLYIEAINATFNAKIPTASVVNYPGVIFP